MIKQIIDENEYNIENYNKLLESKKVVDTDNDKLRKENAKLMDDVKLLQTKVDEFDPKLTREEIKMQRTVFTNTSDNGFLLYAFQIRENRFRCGICRPADFGKRCQLYTGINVAGEMSLSVKVCNPFTEKVAFFLLRNHLTRINNDTFDGRLSDIKCVFDIVAKNEEQLTVKNISLEEILSSFSNQIVHENIFVDPEVPAQRKSRRAIDQISVETGAVIASFPSIEQAGRDIGVTGSAVGIALRNKTLCQGFLFRYSGISKEDQYADQPVIKICCSTGVNTCFQNMADAARDCNISAPGLRNRILTKVHLDDYHWIFDKNSSHYK